MKEPKTAFGRFVRARRLHLGLRQIPLSARIGIEQLEFSHLETGDRPYILTGDQLQKLATELNCDLVDLKKLLPPPKPEPGPKTELGRFLRTQRIAQGLTIDELAARLNVSRGKVLQLERGDEQTMSYPRVRKLSEALNVDTSMFQKYICNPGSEQTRMSRGGQFLRTRRRQKGLSMQEVADLVGVSRPLINLIEIGYRTPTVDLLAKLQEVLEFTLEELTAAK